MKPNRPVPDFLTLNPAYSSLYETALLSIGYCVSFRLSTSLSFSLFMVARGLVASPVEAQKILMYMKKN